LIDKNLIKDFLQKKDDSNSNLRAVIATVIHKSGEGHIPSAFSILDIIAKLYDNHLSITKEEGSSRHNDYFVLSKGHGALALYVVLAKHNLISIDDLISYGEFNSILGGHPDRTKVAAIECSTGSLGHGLPMAVGIAIAQKLNKLKDKEYSVFPEPLVYCLIGDGESMEGTIWESLLLARHHKLDNLIIIIDRNKSADQIVPLPNLVNVFEAMGAEVQEIDGHSTSELDSTLNKLKVSKNNSFKVIIANTIKGKGVDFIEGHGIWHHKIPNALELKEIYSKLGFA
jgi:transketolase